MNENNLIWIDLEMTGLIPDQDSIIEIASIVTTPDLEIIAEGPVLAIHQSEETLTGMNEWCKVQHGKSGLTERVRQSTTSLEEAEQATVNFLSLHVPAGKSPICGNSICQDRRFLAVHMKKLESFFHYRNLDVSTLKELARRWAPDVLSKVQKKETHLALDDIRESILELSIYRKHLFNDLNQPTTGETT
ncbi:oligoribonuclease [bacterium]|nr:oligoribonuclease [bacterium]